MTTEPQPELQSEPQYTIPEAAARLGVRPFTLRDWVTKRKVPHHLRYTRTGVYFTDADLELILSGRARPAQPSGEQRARNDRAVAPTEAAGSSADNRGADSGADSRPTPAAPPARRYGTHVRRGNRAPAASAPVR